jgi:hypothetical protein
MLQWNGYGKGASVAFRLGLFIEDFLKKVKMTAFNGFYDFLRRHQRGAIREDQAEDELKNIDDKVA